MLQGNNFKLNYLCEGKNLLFSGLQNVIPKKKTNLKEGQEYAIKYTYLKRYFISIYIKREYLNTNHNSSLIRMLFCPAYS